MLCKCGWREWFANVGKVGNVLARLVAYLSQSRSWYCKKYQGGVLDSIVGGIIISQTVFKNLEEMNIVQS